jgi:hypothetical protein
VYWSEGRFNKQYSFVEQFVEKNRERKEEEEKKFYKFQLIIIKTGAKK